MTVKQIYRIGIGIIAACCFWGCSSRIAGDYCMRIGNYDAAITYFGEEVSRHPDNLEARTRLGHALYKAGRLTGAVRELEKVLVKRPGDTKAKYWMGMALLKKGETWKGVEHLKAAGIPYEPLFQKKLKQQIALLEITGSMKFARDVLAREKELQTLPPQKNSVAVLYYDDQSSGGKFKYLRKALAAMIISDLSNVKSLHLVERLRVEYLLDELDLGKTGVVEKPSIPRLGRLLGVENLVTGTLDSGSLSIGTGVLSMEQKHIAGAFSLSGKQADFFKMQKKIVFNLLEILNITPTPDEKRILGITATENLQAVIYWGQAMDARDKGHWKEAREYYRKAMEEDPDFLPALEEHRSCPDDSAPDIDQLRVVAPENIVRNIENAVRAGRMDKHRAEGTVKSTGQGEGMESGEDESQEGTGDFENIEEEIVKEVELTPDDLPSYPLPPD